MWRDENGIWRGYLVAKYRHVADSVAEAVRHDPICQLTWVFEYYNWWGQNIKAFPHTHLCLSLVLSTCLPDSTTCTTCTAFQIVPLPDGPLAHHLPVQDKREVLLVLTAWGNDFAQHHSLQHSTSWGVETGFLGFPVDLEWVKQITDSGNKF